jgi:hypothetical protein
MPAFVADSRQHADVMRWRKAERERLIAGRLALNSGDRRACSEKIAARLGSEKPRAVPARPSRYSVRMPL